MALTLRLSDMLQTLQAGQDDPCHCPPPKIIAMEWAAILLVVLGFCAPFLDFDGRWSLPGNEAEVFQSLDWTLVHSLKQYGQFPLWNPYLRTGFPYVADPFLHVYQPLATVPVLLLGVWDGFKVALFLSFLAAALGMWWMGVVLRVGWLSRLWMAFMYAFTGQAAARFFQGQYDFVLGYAWIPWALGSAILALRTRRIRPALGTAVSLSMLFFSGNVYYAFYMTFAMLLLVATTLVGWDSVVRQPRLRTDRVPTIVLIGALSLGLTAIQSLPLLDFKDHYTKTGDPELAGSHSLPQILRDFTSKETVRRDLMPDSPREEHYAYSGTWPLLLLVFLPFAFRSGRQRDLVFLVLLLLFSLAWVSVRHMPWADLYSRFTFLTQFRFQTRMNIYAAVALVGLAGCGLDALWRAVSQAILIRRSSMNEAVRKTGLWLVTVLLIAFAVWSVGDVFGTNRVHVRSREYYDPPYEVMGWLRQHDDSTFYVGSSLGWHGAIISNGMRYLDAWYGFDLVPPERGMINQRPVRPRPRYVAVGNEERPTIPDAELVRRFAQHSLYRVPSSLPYVFAVSDRVLSDPAGGRELEASEVRALPPRLVSPNRIEIVTEGARGEILTVLTNAFGGWKLKVDGRSAELLNVGGYLAARLEPGSHTYVFDYVSAPLRTGLVISLVSLVALLGLVAAAARAPSVRGNSVARYAAPGTELQQGAEERPVSQAEAAPSETENPGSIKKTGWCLFGGALLLYLFTRLYAVDAFPIYFFADEAIHAVYAQELLDRGFKDAGGAYFPLYFEAAGNRWTPLLSVYVHAVPIAILGKSVVLTRATSALVSALGTIAVALILKLIFGSRYWWAGTLLMAVSPAWFLHSRTAFETVMMSSFFACTLLSYLLYRTRSPRYVFATLLFGAATFYTYSNGQVIVVAFATLTLVSDLRYHLKNWRTLLAGLILGVVLALPLVRFLSTHHAPMATHLRDVNSYWFRDIPLVEKADQLVRTYANGLSPAYWFFPNEHDLVRHRMKGYGHLNTWLLPLFLLGLGICLRRVRRPAHRTLLLAALAAPAGAALLDVSITRVLVFVVPGSIIAGLGLNAAMEWLHTRCSLPRWLGAAGLAAALCGSALWMLRDVLVRGPMWYNDYGLYGMQYGATQLFTEAIPACLNADVNKRILVSSTWANGADTFIPFFLSGNHRSRVQMLSIDSFMRERRSLDANTLLVMTPSEYQDARASGKFQSIEVDRIVPYPDGRPGFYFAVLSYAANFEQTIAAEKAARRLLITETVELNGEPLQVSHSALDFGQLRDLFDGNPDSLVRGLGANPLVFDFAFAKPRAMKEVKGTFGSMDFRLTAILTAPDQEVSEVYSWDFRGLPLDPSVEVSFARGPALVSRLRLEILKLDGAEEEHIHIRELSFP